MLVLAAIVFAIALLLLWADKWFDDPDIRFDRAVRVLLFIAAALLALRVFLG